MGWTLVTDDDEVIGRAEYVSYRTLDQRLTLHYRIPLNAQRTRFVHIEEWPEVSQPNTPILRRSFRVTGVPGHLRLQLSRVAPAAVQGQAGPNRR